MCFCTQYDSHCGHSWLSLTDPCGYCHDFLNCTQRDIFQMCIAPVGICPQCFGGFADSETIEMIQGPWGCNQLIRSHIGGSQAIPGKWGTAQLLPPHQRVSQHMLQGFGVDHTLAGPRAPISPPLGMNSPSMVSPYVSSSMAMMTREASPVMASFEGYCGHADGRSNYNREERHYRKYKHKVTHGNPGCIVM